MVLSQDIKYCCCYCSVAQSCPVFCGPMDCSRPGFLSCPSPFPELAQDHVHWVANVIQPSHPLSSPHLILYHPLLLVPSIFPRISVFFNELVLPISWPKCWSSASASVLLMNIQGWIPLGLTGLISLQSMGLSRVFSNTTVQRHQFFGT